MTIREKLESGTRKMMYRHLHHPGNVDEAPYAAVPLLAEACQDGPRDGTCTR